MLKKLKLAVLAAACLLSAGSLTRAAESPELYDAIEGYLHKDYSTAWRQIQSPLQANEAYAYFVAGTMTQDGLGVRADAAASNVLFFKGSNLGDGACALQLGNNLRDGKGCQAEPAKAFQAFRRAAALGNTMALVNTGAMFHNGVGTPVDVAEAYAWTLVAVDGIDQKAAAIARKNIAIFDEKLTTNQRSKATERSFAIRDELKAEGNAIRNSLSPAATAAAGVPATFESRDGHLVVKAVSDPKLVEQESLLPGDVLKSVDGQSVVGKTLEQVKKLIAGPKGSMIQLELTRGDSGVQLAMPRA